MRLSPLSAHCDSRKSQQGKNSIHVESYSLTAKGVPSMRQRKERSSPTPVAASPPLGFPCNDDSDGGGVQSRHRERWRIGLAPLSSIAVLKFPHPNLSVRFVPVIDSLTSFNDCGFRSPAYCWVEVETIEIHDLGPGQSEIIHEFLLCIVAGIDFREGSKLRV